MDIGIPPEPQLLPHELVDEIFITTPPSQEALRAIGELYRFGRRAENCDCLLIAGPSRVCFGVE